jgi:class 3 adenylate cyclase
VVAGVIGRKRFLYDLWGDAVNTASRMESAGTPGRIQVTRATYELLGDDFEFESRGTVSVKGKGEMETWYLVGRR